MIASLSASLNVSLLKCTVNPFSCLNYLGFSLPSLHPLLPRATRSSGEGNVGWQRSFEEPDVGFVWHLWGEQWNPGFIIIHPIMIMVVVIIVIVITVIVTIWLVVSTPLKNSQLGWLFPIYGKIKNVPNHQPAIILHYDYNDYYHY